MLWRHKRYEEARSAYAENLSRLEPVGPTCDLALEARSKIAWLDATVLLKGLVRAKRAREATAPADFERVREWFHTVMAWEREPTMRVQAHEAWITSRYWEDDPAATWRACEEFLSQYADPKDLEPYGREVAAVRVMAADALCALGQFADALAHLRWATSPENPLPADNDVMRASLQYRLWWVLLRSGAPQEEVDQQADVLRLSFPGTSFVTLMDGIIAQEAANDGR